MNCKVLVEGRFKFGTIINNVAHEYDAEAFALNDLYDRCPDIEIFEVETSAEILKEGGGEQESNEKR